MLRFVRSPFGRYVLLGGGVLCLILLLRVLFNADRISFRTLEERLSDAPCEVLRELGNHGGVSESLNEADSLYANYLYNAARLQCEGSVEVGDSVVLSWATRCDSLKLSLLYSRYLKLAGDMYRQKGKLQHAMQCYDSVYARQSEAIAGLQRSLERERVVYGSLMILLVSCLLGCCKVYVQNRNTILRERKKWAFFQHKYNCSKVKEEVGQEIVRMLTEQLETITGNAAHSENSGQLPEGANVVQSELESKKKRVNASLALIRHSEYTARFYEASRDGRISLNRKDWEYFEELVGNEFPFLLDTLYQTPKITVTERRIVLLTLLGIGTLEMSNLLNLKMSSISTAKKTLYCKLTGKNGSAKDLFGEIINIICYSL